VRSTCVVDIQVEVVVNHQRKNLRIFNISSTHIGGAVHFFLVVPDELSDPPASEPMLGYPLSGDRATWHIRLPRILWLPWTTSL
jgi:hypothetical protein